MLRWLNRATASGILLLFVVYSNFELEVDNKHTDRLVSVKMKSSMLSQGYVSCCCYLLRRMDTAWMTDKPIGI